MTAYDSTADTLRHIARVREILADVALRLVERGETHDRSKLDPIEKSAFDELGETLKTLVYGSDEYKATLLRYRDALAHHYAMNSHHPEHYPDGIGGMNLVDLVEMFCDWKAASERTKDGDIAQSVALNVGRFKIEPQLAAILRNTAELLFRGQK